MLVVSERTEGYEFLPSVFVAQKYMSYLINLMHKIASAITQVNMRLGQHVQYARIKPVGAASLPDVTEMQSTSGVPVYVLSGTTEPVIHLELIFAAGKVTEAQRGAAHATAALLTDGTDSMSSRDIAMRIEHYGSTLNCTAGTDSISVSLYCMARYFQQGLDILGEILNGASFPDAEIRIYKQKRLRNLRISLGQNEYIANRMLTSVLFGDHPYGKSTTAEDLEALSRADIQRHFNMIGRDNVKAFVCGYIDDDHIDALMQMLDALKQGSTAPEYAAPDRQDVRQVDIKGPQRHQCAIRLGRQVVSRSHPDFPVLFLLNTIIGGYFGSRLMKNIREQKGLTYNIYSSLDTLVRSAYFVVSTEANVHKADLVLEEIRKELEALGTGAIGDEELRMVKNYMMGSLKMQLDGPFRAMEVIKSMVMESVRFDAFEVFLEAVIGATATQLNQAARTYFPPSELSVVVVR